MNTDVIEVALEAIASELKKANGLKALEIELRLRQWEEKFLFDNRAESMREEIKALLKA